ncbi:MAG: hypothetical protein ABEI06_05540 [Halobacteriaceae archaeon]
MTENIQQELEQTAEEYVDTREEIQGIGKDTLSQLQDAYSQITSLLDQYEETATGSGDFESYIEFRTEITEYVENLPESFPEHETFEEIAEIFDQRRLSTRDFKKARRLLSPIEDQVAKLDRFQDKKQEYKNVRGTAITRLREIEDQIEELEYIKTLGEADLEAPIEKLQDPIETYNDNVQADFDEFIRTTRAEDVISFLETTQAYPLIDFQEPPPELVEYLTTKPAGEETIPQLLEYASYSLSKLDHYIEDPAALHQHVGNHEVYLNRLDADPLQIAWPPPKHTRLQWQIKEIQAALNRFATNETIASLHTIKNKLQDPEQYSHLRQAAIAIDELTAKHRQQLRNDEISDKLDELQVEKNQLQTLLDEYPDVS